MEDFLSFDEVMGVYSLNIEPGKVFPTIKEEDMEVVEQVDGGHEATMNIMMDGGHPKCAASSSSKWGFPYGITLFHEFIKRSSIKYMITKKKLT